MLRLEPIKVIPIDLGKPTDFTPPSTDNFIRSLVDEANAAEDCSDALYEAEETRWRQSLTPDEKAAYELLEAAEREAETNYLPRRDNMMSEPAQAYFKANDAKDRFYESHGRHICFRCSYYTKSREDKTHVAECFKKKKVVRPMCDSCQCFTIDYTPEDREIDQKESIYLAAHPQEAERRRRKREQERAERIASNLKEGRDSVEFILYNSNLKDGSATHKDSYRRYPDIFANTKYPTFEEFKAAAEAWLAQHSEWVDEEEGA
jgi:hypothetical protein